MNNASKTALCPDCDGQRRHSHDPETGYERAFEGYRYYSRNATGGADQLQSS